MIPGAGAGENSVVQLAKTARSRLAMALALLQAPEAGNLIDSVAPPVALAMGGLHRIESSQGAALGVEAKPALLAVHEALTSLDTVPPSNPVVDATTEHLAMALGALHGLARRSHALGAPGRPAAAAPPAPAPQQPPAPSPAAQPAAPPMASTLMQASPIVAKVHSPGTAPTQAQPAAAPQAPAHPAPAHPGRSTIVAGTQAIPAETGPSATAAAPVPAAPPPAPSPAPPAAVQAEQPAIRARQSSASELLATAVSRDAPDFATEEKAVERKSRTNIAEDSRVAAPPTEGPTAGSVTIEANLGAHSDTNFYKGLSGNDVIEDGGIFIATYEILRPGTNLWIRVHLPGGYAFEASGVVRWTRHPGSGVTTPGFGAAFQRLSAEARQLVYRYTRNREPLFYDDF